MDFRDWWWFGCFLEQNCLDLFGSLILQPCDIRKVPLLQVKSQMAIWTLFHGCRWQIWFQIWISGSSKIDQSSGMNWGGDHEEYPGCLLIGHYCTRTYCNPWWWNLSTKWYQYHYANCFEVFWALSHRNTQAGCCSGVLGRAAWLCRCCSRHPRQGPSSDFPRGPMVNLC